jgi:poly-gamma-glutamate synthesis protein (capsule biosynthesis protein)
MMLTDSDSFHIPGDVISIPLFHREAVGRSARVIALGDIGFSGRVGHGVQHADLFAAVRPFLRSADICFANLETPLLPGAGSDMLFAARSDAAPLLGDAGFNLLHLANNHIYDYGVPGMLHTLECLESAEIRSLGVGRNQAAAAAPLIWQVGELEIGWIGAGESMRPPAETRPLFNEIEEARLIAQVRTLEAEVDIVVVSLHAGAIYSDYPKPELRQLTHRMAEAGADVVLVHNAHVIQGVEIVNDKCIICHNLGNGLFDWQEGHVRSETMVFEQRSGAIFAFEFDATGLASATAMPIWVDDELCIQWATGAIGAQVSERLRRLSDDLKGNYESRYHQQRAQRTTRLLGQALWHHLRNGNWQHVNTMIRRFRPHHLRMMGDWLLGRLKRKQT